MTSSCAEEAAPGAREAGYAQRAIYELVLELRYLMESSHTDFGRPQGCRGPCCRDIWSGWLADLASYAQNTELVFAPWFWHQEVFGGQSVLGLVCSWQPHLALCLLRRAEVDLSGAWGVRLAGLAPGASAGLVQMLFRYGLDVRSAQRPEGPPSMWTEFLRGPAVPGCAELLEVVLEKGPPPLADGAGGAPVPAEAVAAAWALPGLQASRRWRGLRAVWVAATVRAALGLPRGRR